MVVYPRERQNLRERFRTVIAGGPVASLLLGAIAGAIWLVQGNDFTSFLRMLVPIVAVLSTFMGVFGFLPIHQPHCVSDGVRFWMLRRDTPESRRACALMLLAAEILNGKRPRDWDPASVEAISNEAADPAHKPDDYAARAILYNWLMETGRLDDAEKLLMTIVSGELTPFLKAIWMYQVAWFKAFYVRDLGAAREWFARVKTRGKKPVELQLARDQAQAAIAFLEHRWDDADAAAQSAIDQSDRIIEISSGNQIKEKLEQLREEIRKGRESSSRHASNAQ